MAKDKSIPSNIILAKEKFKYDTIQDMVNDIALKVGMVVDINGYYKPDDGATHKRVIADTDDGSGVQLRSGKWACIVHNGEINIKWLGAKGDGVFDNTDIFRNLKHYITYSVTDGMYLTNDFIVPYNTNIYGDNTGTIKQKTKTQLFIQCYKNTEIKGIEIIGNGGDYGISVSNGHFKSGDHYHITNSSLDCRIHNIKISGFDYSFRLYAQTATESGRGFWGVDIFDFFCSSKGTLFIDRDETAGGWITSCKMFNFRSFPQTNHAVVRKTGKTGMYYFSIFDCDIQGTKDAYIYLYDKGSYGDDHYSNIRFHDFPTEPFSKEGSQPYFEEYSTSNNTKYKTMEFNFGEQDSRFNNACLLGYYYDEETLVDRNISILLNFTTNGISYLTKINIFISREKTETGFDYSGSKFEFYNLEGRNAGIDFDAKNLGRFAVAYNKELGRTELWQLPNHSYWSGYEYNAIILNNPFGFIAHSSRTYAMQESKYPDFSHLDNPFELVPTMIKKPDYQHIIKDGEDLNNIINNGFFVSFSNGNNIINAPKGVRAFHLINLGESYPFQILNQLNSEKLHVRVRHEGDIWSSWKQIQIVDEVAQLNTLYHGEKMKQEGVYNDYISYMDEKTAYDKQQRRLEQDRQLAYEEALKENPNLTYEEFMSVQPMTLNLVEEPQPSENLKKFMEKYL